MLARYSYIGVHAQVEMLISYTGKLEVYALN